MLFTWQLKLLLRKYNFGLGFILFIYYLVKRENIAIKFFSVEDKRLGKLLSAGLGVAFVYSFISFTLPSIMDIPYLARNEYCVLEGIAESNCSQTSKTTCTRVVEIRGEEQENTRIRIAGGCGDVFVGDELTVKYLPHTHYGCVVEHKPAK